MTHIKIKEVSLPRFEVRLLLLENGKFVIEHENNVSGGVSVSEMLFDYHTADYLFELKVEELVGH